MSQCPKCNGEMWDNRHKKASGTFSAKSPDFKCKDKNCDGVIWPPKDAAPAKAAAVRPPKAARTWEQWAATYEHALRTAGNVVIAGGRKAGIPVTMADVVAAAATVFIAVTRDGVQEAMTDRPAALDDEPEGPLPF